MIKIAIIGSGISGLSLACKLNNKYSLTIFEKSRTVSGRLATKKVQNLSSTNHNLIYLL